MRRSQFAIFAVSALVATSCSPAAPPPSSPPASAKAAAPVAPPSATLKAPDPYPDDAEIAKAAKAYLDLVVATSPEKATALGLHARDAELDPYTIAGHDDAVAREDAMAKELRARFASPRASAAAKTDLALIVGALEVDVRVKRVQRPLQRQPDFYASPLDAVFLMTAREYAPAPERAKNVVARLEKIPAVVAAAKENLLNPPRVWTEVGIDRASSARAFLEAQRPFLERALPAERPRVDAALRAAEAAYDDYASFLQKKVLPRSNGRFAAGRELFDFLLANDDFLDEGADDVRAMAKKVFDQTNAEMTALAKKIDPKAKGWPEVVAKLKGDHPTAGGLLDAYRKEVGRARSFVVERGAVALPPGDDLDVVETPSFLRSTITAAYDMPPPFDASTTKGFFFVTPVEPSMPKKKQEQMLRENDHGDLVDTAVHEAYPGHHLQLSFARQNPSLIRKAVDHAVFSEGWALYAEELMAELGYYTDAERMMQLEWTLVRAARVLIDVGLHTAGMSFEDAVKMLTDEVHLERPLALSEVKRYTLTPTQPLAYLVGRQGILALRERVKADKGAAFSLAAFHADLLSRGTVPPALTAREMFGAQPR